MRHSVFVSCAILALALGLAEANNYGRGRHQASRAHGNPQAALSHYGGGGGGCHGHQCNQAPARGPYGPYHSYAVRPVVYGGHGNYAYRGYARYPPAAARPQYRASRSAYNHNNNQVLHHQIGGQNYALKPIKALVLGPAPSSYGRQHRAGPRRAPSAYQQQQHRGPARNQNRHHYRAGPASGHRYPQRHQAVRSYPQHRRPAAGHGHGYGRQAGRKHHARKSQASGGY